MTDELEMLKRLEQQVHSAIVSIESGMPTRPTGSNDAKYIPRGCEFVIGDFAIHVLTPYDRVIPNQPAHA